MSEVLSAVKGLIYHNSKFLVLEQVVGHYNLWDLPGGKVEYGESPFDTLHREVKEETDLDIEIIKPLGLWWFYRKSDRNQVVCNTFLCDSDSHEVDLSKNPAKEQIRNYEWVKKKDFLSDKYEVSHDSLKNLVRNLR